MPVVLLPMMKLRFAEPAHLVDINGIESLRGICLDGDQLVVGAMTTEKQLIASELLHTHCPLLPEAARNISDPQVRNRGTIGGDIACGDPANDHPALMIACNASFTLTGPAGSRSVPAEAFFLGTYWTALEADEVLTDIRLPVFTAGTARRYLCGEPVRHHPQDLLMRPPAPRLPGFERQALGGER